MINQGRMEIKRESDEQKWSEMRMKVQCWELYKNEFRINNKTFAFQQIIETQQMYGNTDKLNGKQLVISFAI